MQWRISVDYAGRGIALVLCFGHRTGWPAGTENKTMALTDTDIAQFAKFAVEHGSDATYKATPERKAKLRKEAESAALSYFEQAQDDLRGSGYRVTRRVKAILWQTLMEI
jgi:hypothetical protein